jgi:hypothetical protein
MRYFRHVACVGQKRNIYMVLVGDPEGKMPMYRSML